MEFELKNFEEKINDITEQFMSLLDSNYVIGDSITANFDSTSTKDFNSLDNNKIGETCANNTVPNYYNNIKVGGMAFSDSQPTTNPVSFDTGVKPVGGISFANAVPETPNASFDSFNQVSRPIAFEKVNLECNSPVAGIEGLKLDETNISPVQFGGNTINFDTFDQRDLDKRLEELYQTTKTTNNDVVTEHPFVFSDSNIGGYMNNHQVNFNEVSNNNGYNANDKEGYTMANYDGEDSLFSFATVPEERALTTKRNFADVLFMDIPWDTKIDVWGGFKTLFTTDVRITF